MTPPARIMNRTVSFDGSTYRSCHSFAPGSLVDAVRITTLRFYCASNVVNASEAGEPKGLRAGFLAVR